MVATRLIQAHWFFRFLNDLFKPWVITKRVPPWMQTELAVGDWARNSYNFLELLNCEILFADPCTGNCQISQDFSASHGVLGYRKNLDRAPAVRQSIVPV